MLSSSLNILVAEDNTINQKIISRMLEKLGHQVDLTTDAVATLSALGQQSYQVVLLEAHLFNLDELTQLQQLKHQSSSPSLRLMVMRSDPEVDAQLLKQVEVDSFLDKPLKFPALQQSLNTLFSASPPPEILDPPTIQALKEVMGEDFPMMWQELLGRYQQDSEKLAETIQRALEAEDAEQLQHAAHTLKSSSAAIGAKTLAQICLKLEQSGRNRQLQTAKLLISSFEIAYNQVKTALKQELD